MDMNITIKAVFEKDASTPVEPTTPVEPDEPISPDEPVEPEHPEVSRFLVTWLDGSQSCITATGLYGIDPNMILSVVPGGC
jgi:hypothetical protein